MNLSKKAIILSFALGLGILPSFAKIDGKVSTGHFYDMKKTIMSEVIVDKNIKTEKYWEKNLFYFNKYRPLFMLSNKELYDLMPKDNVSVVQRISTPSIYNISLKSSSIKTVSFSSIAKKQEQPKAVISDENSDSKIISIYEKAKSAEIDPEQKVEAAVSLKNSKNPSGYDLAIDLLDEVIKKEPYNAYAYYLKGEVYAAQNKPEPAMRNYIEALKINPASKQSCLGIAKILEPTNKILAQKYYEKAR